MIGTWIAVGTGITVASFFSVRLALENQARSRKISPPADRPCLSPDATRERLRGLTNDESPISVLEEGDLLTISWQLMGIPWATILFRQKLRRTDALELRVTDDGRVWVRSKRGDVAWVNPAATWMPRAEVTWRKPELPVSPPPSRSVPPPIEKETPRSPELLVETVRHCVLDCGQIWEPVVVFPT